MQDLHPTEIGLVHGGFTYDEASLSRMFGSLFNSPASVAWRTPTGFGLVVGAFQLGYQAGQIAVQYGAHEFIGEAMLTLDELGVRLGNWVYDMTHTGEELVNTP